MSIRHASYTIVLLLSSLHATAQDPPIVRLSPSEAWRVSSFVEDAGLAGKAIFHLDFEPGGAAWFAASDGLYRYDGYRWRRFGMEDGLPSDYVRCVRVTRAGEVWVGTDRGAARVVDGRFDPSGTEHHLLGSSVRRIVEEQDGSLWFCCDRWPDPRTEGGLARRDPHGGWHRFDTAGWFTDYISDLFVDGRGRRFVLTRLGLGLLQDDGRLEPVPVDGAPKRAYVWDLVEGPVGLVATTDDGVLVERDGSWSLLPGVPRPCTKLCRTSAGTVLTCDGGPGTRFLAWDGDAFVPATEANPIASSHIEALEEAPDGAVWAVGEGLLVRWEANGGEWSIHTGLPPLYLIDHTGRPLFADRSRVVRHGAHGWEEVTDMRTPISGGPGAVTWSMAASGLARRSRDAGAEYIPLQDLGLQEVLGIHPVSPTAAWVVGHLRADRMGLVFVDGRHVVSVEAPELDEVGSFEVRAGNEGTLWVLLRGLGGPNRLFRFRADERAEWTLPTEPRIDPYPHVRVDADGAPWLFGFFGLIRGSKDSADDWHMVNGLLGRAVTGIEWRNDALWALSSPATGGVMGISVLRGEEWTHRSAVGWSFVGYTSDGRLLVSAPQGLVAFREDGSSSVITVPTHERALGAVGARGGEMWIQMEDRVLHYVPDDVPPETFVSSERRVQVLGGNHSLAVDGAERLRPRSQSGGLTVELSVDGGEWFVAGALRDGLVGVPGLTLGRHDVGVRLRDEAGDVDPSPARAVFEIVPAPIQLRSWFLPTVAGVVLVIAVLAIAAVVAWRRLGLLAIGLERTIEARTEELHASEARLREAQKLEVVGRLAAGITHEFNNILTVMIGHGELLATSMQDDGDAQESLREILDQADRARTVIAQVSSFCRESGGGAGSVRLDEVIGDADRLLRVVLGTSIRLEIRCAAGDAAVGMDRGKLEQVVINTCLNARDAMPEGGCLRLETGIAVDEAAAFLRVQDDGNGMAPSTAERIFDPFFTTKPRGKGTGLGLAIVKDLIEEAGGRIAVRSVLGQGTTFEVTLPQVTAMVSENEEPQGTAEEGAGQRILVVEDEPSIRRLLGRTLQEAGYQVDTAADPVAVLEALETSNRRYGLVLTDVVMEGASGFEVAEWFQTHRTETAVVLMSGYIEPGERPDIVTTLPFLTKPFSESELRRVVAEAVKAEGVQAPA